MHGFIIGALPTLATIQHWVLTVFTQAVVILVAWQVVKHFAKMSIGKIIVALIAGGFVGFAITNYTLITGWVTSFFKML
ncbi:hypothetical protein HB825_01510 [Listeria booriae]|uniref:Uncharacterized protein n=1 Tax=Listeria booriae TaxID=1552123 RepID=A0A099WDD3_9LIST|nr:TcpD family membrane protein [Listeria booriae]KGL42696.1 hypothetical protein EP57_04345 [Listeria booriae]MBC1292247.1 hypothetical protein [Listeria booriae]MBC1400890.1 hypothetical protein [Listeria booriae]MBC1502424.1 hypothetical protein [Listeria booriae]MBC1559433.1 hypothetical protein [Listeria booriae]